MIVDHLFDNKKNLQEGVAEGGPFSYGKPPRKGSVAANAEQKRKEQDKKTPAIEPKDQQVGVAKVTKGTMDLATLRAAAKTAKPVNTDVAETSDYSRRREREEDIISGKRPARQRTPAQTSDYARRRAQEKKSEQGVAEGELTEAPGADDAAQHVYANNTEVPWAVDTATGKNYTVDQLQGVTKRKRFSPSSVSTAPAAAAPTSPSVPRAPIIKYNFNLPASGTAAPASGTAAPAGGEPPATPAADQASKVGVGQINKIIPTLRTRDLTSVKKTVDATIAKKAKPAPAAGTADSGVLANMANQLSSNTPNTMANAPVSKTNKAKPGNPNAAPAAPKATSVPKAPGIKYNINLPAGGGAGVKAAPVSKGTKVVSGGPTPDEQAKLARRIAQAAKQPVAEMLAMVETKEDVAKIKQFIDQTFVKHGAVNETAFAVRNQLIEHVTQVGAQRRREHSQRMAK